MYKLLAGLALLAAFVAALAWIPTQHAKSLEDIRGWLGIDAHQTFRWCVKVHQGAALVALALLALAALNMPGREEKEDPSPEDSFLWNEDVPPPPRRRTTHQHRQPEED